VDIAQGNLFKELELQLTLDGVAFPLLEADEEEEIEADTLVLRWTDANDDVTEVTPTVVDYVTGEIKHAFQEGETDVIGTCRGQVTVTRDGKGLSFPDDGSFFLWTVTRRI
jgi:hypothetical protein